MVRTHTAFYGVNRIEAGDIRKYVAGEFVLWARTLTLWDDGDTGLQVTLTSYTADGLLFPGEQTTSPTDINRSAELCGS